MPPGDTTPPAISAKALTLAAHASFVPIGIVTVMLGPMLPALSARWSLNEAQAGLLFTAQFIGSSCGVAISGIVATRWGRRTAMIAGLIAMSGVAFLLYGSREVGAALIALYGFGSGIAVPAGNLLVADLHPARRSAALSRLNFSWSLGAVACPFLIAAAGSHMALMLAAVSGVLLAVAAGIAMIPASKVSFKFVSQEEQEPLPLSPRPERVRALAGLFFLYVGTEVAFGGWVASYAKGLGSMSATWYVVSPSFFYGALMLGRWLAPFFLRGVEEVMLARAGLVVACVGIAGMIWSQGRAGVVVSAVVAGFGFAAVYPVMISLLARICGAEAARVGAIMFALSNVGGACLPWLVGVTAQRFGNLKAGLAVPLATGLIMFVLYSRDWSGGMKAIVDAT
jgi:FHS family glucose/mannose:H+ symporter-like MFS transporter